MAEYTNITESGPLTGKQLAQQNNDNYTYGRGPQISPTYNQILDEANKQLNTKIIVNPNNTKISTKSERESWWEKEGRTKYSERFSDLSIDKRGEFKDRTLERIYRNVLFKKAFKDLPEYSKLKALNPDDRDSFYTEWHGRAGYQKGKNKKGEEVTFYGLYYPNGWEESPYGREATVIKSAIENSFPGLNTDKWSAEDRKEFYEDWDVANAGSQQWQKAVTRHPELLTKSNFYSQEELDNYYKTAFDRIFNAGIGTGPKIISSDPMSVNSVQNESLAKIQPIISDLRQEYYNSLNALDISRWSDETMYNIEHSEERKAEEKARQQRLENYEKEWYKLNPANYYTGTGTYNSIFTNRKKAARRYAEEQEKLYNMTEQERKEYQEREKRLQLYRDEYNNVYGKMPFFRYSKSNPGLFKNHWRFDLSASNLGAERYAQEENATWERQNYTIPEEENPFVTGITLEEMPRIAANFSGLYKEFYGSTWMPENEIPWNKIYERTKDLWKSGHIAEAIFQMDRIIEDDVIAEHQGLFSGKDNLGHASSLESAWNNFYSMGIESLVEAATFAPSALVGLAQAAFNPSELQTESGMNFFNRALDNMIHNDWLGFASNQNVSDWASEIMENNPIYGYNIGEYILKGAGTFGAQAGNFIMFWAGGLEAGAARKLLKDAAKVTERVAKKEIVNAGKTAKYNTYINKTVDNLNLFKANYGEAMQQSLEGERQVYQEGESRKKELIEKYRPEPQYLTTEGSDGIVQYTLVPFEAHFTQEELEEALSLQPNGEAWKTYFDNLQKGITTAPPDTSITVEAFIDKVRRDAEGLHKLYQEIPDFNDNIAINAKLKANIDLVTQTTLLFGFDKLFGGLDKWTLDFAKGRRALQPKDLVNKIKGIKIGNLKPNKQWLKGIWTGVQNPVMETITELGQQSGSAITKQIAEHNINSFLENQLYGNGLQSWAAANYEGLYNLNKEEFGRDAQLKETLIQTLLTTPLMPVLGGYRGGRSQRGQNQSWVSRALENIHYFSPIKTTIGQQLYNIGQHNKQLQAAVDYINRWGADPTNQANTRGLIGVQNYTEKMIADLINNDEVAYNNDVFSRTLSEAIMLANTQGTDFSQNRLQWLTNMAQIKSATTEQKAAAIQSMRNEAAGNSAVRNLSDEELLDLMETSSKKVLDTYNKVNNIISSDERFTDGTYNWQQQSALIFNRMAREDLQTRIADKEARIKAALQSLGEIDLGESKTSKERIENDKINNKKVLLSGRDILALSPSKRAAMLDPRNLKSYSSEQQKIIQETINALNQVDGNVLNDIRNAGLEEYHLMQIEKDYKASLQTPNWQSTRVKNKANDIKNAFNFDGNSKAFNTKLSQANTVQDIYGLILNEREANATRDDDSRINIESILNNIQDPNLKQKVSEARKIERTSNAIKSSIASTNLSDDIKDNLIQQVDKIASESSSVTGLTDISNYSIPLPSDGRDLSGDVTNILQAAAQTASNTQTVNSEPVENFKKPTNTIPKPTNLGNRDIDTGTPVNDKPLVKYTLEEAKEKLKELNDQLAQALADNTPRHDFLLIQINSLQNELEKRLPEGYFLKTDVDNNNKIIIKIIKTSSENSTLTPQTESEKDDLNDVNNRKEEAKQPVDRDGVTKVAEIQFKEGGRVYSYPIRNEDVQLGDGVNNTVGSETGKVINIRDVQDDAEAEFLIYRTDENGNKVKRDRPQFIDRHSQQQGVKPEEQVKSEEPETSIEEQPVSNRYSNRSEYQQSVVDNNITPAVTELDGTALSKGLFELNQHTGQPNVMRQLQEEGAFDYVNKGALNEGDEIEFVVSQEQMPDGSMQVVIWEVTKPKDGEERNNPKWHGRQLLNVLDQTEVEGKRAELIDRIRKAYEEAGRPESFLYPDEKFVVDGISHSIIPFKQTNPTEASSEETIESTNLQKGLTKQNGIWGISFFNKAKGKMVHVPIIFRQAKRDRNGATKILLSDQRLKSKTIEIQKTNVGQTGDITDVTMVLPTPKGFVSAMSVYVLNKNIPNSSDKYKESIRTGSVGKALINKIKAHLNDIKTISAFSDYLGFRRGFSEYIYNDRTYGRIDLGYRGSTGNNVLVSAIPSNGKYILVDPTDARNTLNDNNGQGFTLDEVCKEYLFQLVDNPEADVTMRLNMEAIENNPNIITDLIDDGLLWAPNSLNARFVAANTQFNSSLNNEAKIESKKEVKQEPQQPKETPKPAPVVSSTNPSTTTTEVKKTKPKVDDTVELGSKVKRRKLKASQSNQTGQEAPTTPTQEPVTNPTVVSNPSSFETLSEKDKQHVLSKITKEEWDNLTREEQDNILNC